jgi:hypothetical protein
MHCAALRLLSAPDAHTVLQPWHAVVLDSLASPFFILSSSPVCLLYQCKECIIHVQETLCVCHDSPTAQSPFPLVGVVRPVHLWCLIAHGILHSWHNVTLALNITGRCFMMARIHSSSVLCMFNLQINVDHFFDAWDLLVLEWSF